ncbi:tight adherence protein B [Naumannella cuiyingiana]|uniref:Tight adherence protein B n=1 Tax=Naumannella cuiyingiana TaxID=1347891 RepID=A0A7Z0IL91_9ACTN|nr:type II secretion system F family protein [Naumannella cuiyingiana]NYI71389.1 tight adherence protein B [Naumannella cuiyingiana]
MSPVLVGLAALAAALAAIGWCGARAPTDRLTAPLPGRVRRAGRWRWLGIAAPVIMVAGYAAAGPGAVLLSLSAVLVVAAVVLVARAQFRARRAAARRDQVAEACQVIAQHLRSGAMPGSALEDAAAEYAVLGPAAATARLGGDPVRVLFAAARAPGAAGLADLARAWSLITSLGAPAGPLLERIAENVRQARDLDRSVRSELAAPRLTGRLLAVLPAAGLAIGFAVGGDPLGFLTGTLAGQACLLAGVILAVAGVLWSERIAGTGEDEAPTGGGEGT